MSVLRLAYAISSVEKRVVQLMLGDPEHRQMNRIHGYSPPQVDRIWFWAYYNTVPIYPIFCLLAGTIEVSEKLTATLSNKAPTRLIAPIRPLV